MKPQIRLRRTGNSEQFAGHSKESGLFNSLILKHISVNSVVSFLTIAQMKVSGNLNRLDSLAKLPSPEYQFLTNK